MVVIPLLARKPSAVFVSGLLLLAAAALVYALERPAETVLFLPAALSLHDGYAHLPPLLGGPLPTFLHTVAFALMTAALLGPGLNRAIIACAAWVAVDVLFEVAQHPSFPRIFGAGMGGYFDPMDLAAAALGGAAAFCVLRFHTTRGGRCE